MSPVIFFVAFFLATYLFIYLKAADRIRRKHAQRAYPRFDPRTPESLPRAVQLRFAEDLSRLEALGFAFVTYLHYEEMPEEDDGDADVYLALLKNEESGDTAAVAEFFVRVMHVSSHHRILTFATDFGGGEYIRTNNSSVLGVFEPEPGRVGFQFPGVEDSRFLYRLHRALVERREPGRKGVLPSPGMEVPHLCESEARTLRYQVERGYFYIDESRGMCRHTWKGALVMTGKLMYGIKEVRLALMKRRVRATLKSLGLKA